MEPANVNGEVGDQSGQPVYSCQKSYTSTLVNDARHSVNICQSVNDEGIEEEKIPKFLPPRPSAKVRVVFKYLEIPVHFIY